jgi:hypothetical protein
MTDGTNPNSFMPNEKEIGPRMTGILSCGLRERVQEMPSRIYCGTLVMTDDTFHLKRANSGTVLDVSFWSFDGHRFERQQVSILGHLGGRLVPGGQVVPSIIAKAVASHAAIARRAYEIHQSAARGSATDNWLRAERELLAS